MNEASTTLEKGLVREEQILKIAKSLFAQHGFDSVSMRDLAKAIGITPPALYHYFPTKKSLQVATLVAAHQGHVGKSIDAFAEVDLSAEERMYEFVYRMAKRFHDNPELLALIEHAILSPDEDLQRALMEEVIMDHFVGVQDVMSKLAPHFDSHMLATFMFGLVIHTYGTRRMRSKFPGFRVEHDDPTYVAEQVMKLIRGGLWADRA